MIEAEHTVRIFFLSFEKSSQIIWSISTFNFIIIEILLYISDFLDLMLYYMLLYLVGVDLFNSHLTRSLEAIAICVALSFYFMQPVFLWFHYIAWATKFIYFSQHLYCLLNP